MTQSSIESSFNRRETILESSARIEATEFSELLKLQKRMIEGELELEELKLSNPKVPLHTHRRQIAVTAELLQRRTALFCVRIVLALLIIVASSLFMLSSSPVLFVIGLIAQGAMYVHLIELQHSVLHMQAFESARVSRLVGFFLGIPMMISFSDFQYRHLRHHKYLGTVHNTETFNYSHSKLNTLTGFFSATFDYSRWKTVVERIYNAYAGRQIAENENSYVKVRVQQEYQIFGILLACMVSLSLLMATPWPLVLWLAPLFAAEPVHFLLELPEHFGLPAHSNPDVFHNTRIWGGSWFARWFTHNTNYHLAHHFNQRVPMDKLPELTKQLEPYIPDQSRSASYPDFYIEVFTGKTRPDFLDHQKHQSEKDQLLNSEHLIN